MSSNYSSQGKLFNKFTIQICREGFDWKENHISFPAFLTAFSDTFKPNYTIQNVVYRPDGIQNYNNTTRTISIGFTVVSDSYEEGEKNFIKISKLAKWQYPKYNADDLQNLNRASVVGPPRMMIKFLNFVTSYNQPLLGVFENVAFNPVIESGFFIKGTTMYPKEFKISLSITVSNVPIPGWLNNNKWSVQGKYGFPYNLDAEAPPKETEGKTEGDDKAGGGQDNTKQNSDKPVKTPADKAKKVAECQKEYGNNAKCE